MSAREMRGVGRTMGGQRVVASAEEFPEVPGAWVIVQSEGARLPAGKWRVLARVDPWETRWMFRDLAPTDILLVADFPSWRWWQRHYEQQAARTGIYA